jgi:hypothetical protein
MTTPSDFIEEKVKEFETGNYSFRFEYTDRDGKRRWETAFINANLPKEEALKMVGQHVSEFPEGRITDFIENNYFKSFLRTALLEQREEIAREMLEMCDKVIMHTAADYYAMIDAITDKYLKHEK